ncbi:DinB family protein [Halobacillus salinus]|uniref:DinB family protein n=1 Tax=Halobacillus salinus TaxID=192814 RepID=A0A4Z0H369_9BACI|nr:DinB family protein [Halobacillus salinus]TGB03861.1 DinB family protein [Halobacillus salinus]
MYGLDEKRKQVLDFVNTISDEEAKKKPAEDRWSILEVLEHLYLMEQLVVYQINRAIKEGDIQQTPEKPIENTTDRGYKVEAPEAVQPKGEFTSIQDAKDGLEKTREATLFLVHNKDKETLENRAFPHPAFGDMNLEQWVEFIGWHELRHLDQMKEVKQAI